jgi:hypothetical protein
VVGPRSKAVELKSVIKDFLKAELNLELSEEKTLITNSGNSKARFLGVNIQRTSSVRGEIKHIKNLRGHSVRIPTTSMILTAPMTLLIDRMIEKEMATRRKGTIIPLPLAKFANLPIRDLILKYRTMLNGILNYYSFAKNKPQLLKIY